MAASSFVYVSYIRTTPEKVWRALTSPELWNRCWMGAAMESDWMAGSPWRAKSPDGRLYDSGEVLENVPQKRLALSWRNEWNPEFKSEGSSTCVYEIEPVGISVKFTITHSIGLPESRFIASVSAAWPLVGSNLKSLLETGEVALRDNPRHTNENSTHR